MQDVYAMKPVEFKDRVVCGNQYELAIALDNGNLEHVACYADYYTAKNAMDSHSNDNVVILARAYNKVYGETRTEIADAKYALLDLSVNTQKPYSHFFPDAGDDTTKDTYMDTGTLYRSVDGAYLSVNWPNRVAHVKIAGYDGWVNFISSWTNWLTNDYQIVPLAWVKSSNYYVVTDSAIHHYLINNIYEEMANPYYINLGPKPDMLEAGTYYSYDGKYFYRDRKSMLQDYKEGVHTRAVNSSKPYYNYYMYLPQHSRTTYSSADIDQYIRNQLGYQATVFDEYDFISSNRYLSKLYGQGSFFYNAQQTYGVNAIVMLGITRNESANGRSRIAIDKNNGFGDGAVDSSAYQSAKTYASFANTIYAYSHNLFTYGYSNPYDWRYHGSILGNKGVGMNVQYASDPYWSEKAVSYYNQFDYARSDYNFYQLGVTNQDVVYAYASASYGSKKVYSYDKKDYSMILVDQIDNSEGSWYKVVSDLNIDANKNQITEGPYDWENSYVYVPVSMVNKINEGKNGMISPEEVYHYADYDYSYEVYASSNVLHQSDTTSAPKVAKLTNDVTFYYDAALTMPVESKTFTPNGNVRVTGAKANTYVMVYAVAKDASGTPVAYLVTSDYRYNQQDWIPAGNIEFVGLSYGKENVDNGAHYAWVNSTPTDTKETVISGFYNRTYFPILGEVEANGIKWYKVPADMNGTIGYVMANDLRANVTYYQGEVINTAPVITASDKTVVQGNKIDLLEGVSATDKEDGKITDIQVSGEVNFDEPGEYPITYTVVDTLGLSTSKTITVTVLKDEEPVITAFDIEMTLGGKKPDLLHNVTATDKEDGDLLEITVDDHLVEYDKIGKYSVTYTVSDQFGHIVTKTVTLTIMENQKPVIYATDKSIVVGSDFDPKEGVTAWDQEDGDLTDEIKVIKNLVKENETGTYEVTYEVTDTYQQRVEKTILVTVVDKSEKEGTFYLDYFKEIDGKLAIKGYHTINGIDNTLDENFKYYLVFEDLNDSSKSYQQPLDRITDTTEMTRPVLINDGKDYTYSWFKGELDLSSIPQGDYRLYLVTESDAYYSKTIVNNRLYKEQFTTYDNEKHVICRNNYSGKIAQIELMIRDSKLGSKTGSFTYNQFDQYRTLKFNEDHTLQVLGTSYSYGADMGLNAIVNRYMIFENKETYETYRKSLGSITSGMYPVTLPVTDQLGKERAWYQANLNLEDIPVGEYVIYISNETNMQDIGEFRKTSYDDISKVTTTVNGKKYSFVVDEEKRNRVELIVEKA